VYTRIHADLCGESRVYRIRMLQRLYPRIYACLGGCRRVYGIFEGNQQGQMLVAESLIWV
jgi:hypothetical protein